MNSSKAWNPQNIMELLRISNNWALNPLFLYLSVLICNCHRTNNLVILWVRECVCLDEHSQCWLFRYTVTLHYRLFVLCNIHSIVLVHIVLSLSKLHNVYGVIILMRMKGKRDWLTGKSWQNDLHTFAHSPAICYAILERVCAVRCGIPTDTHCNNRN